MLLSPMLIEIKASVNTSVTTPPQLPSIISAGIVQTKIQGSTRWMNRYFQSDFQARESGKRVETPAISCVFSLEIRRSFKSARSDSDPPAQMTFHCCQYEIRKT